jgi:hypothetical protein
MVCVCALIVVLTTLVRRKYAKRHHALTFLRGLCTMCYVGCHHADLFVAKEGCEAIFNIFEFLTLSY